MRPTIWRSAHLAARWDAYAARYGGLTAICRALLRGEMALGEGDGA